MSICWKRHFVSSFILLPSSTTTQPRVSTRVTDIGERSTMAEGGGKGRGEKGNEP